MMLVLSILLQIGLQVKTIGPSPIIRTRVRKYTPVSTLYFQKSSQAIILPVYGERDSDSRIDSGSICTK